MRMRQYIDDIEDLHRELGGFIGERPWTIPPEDRKQLRINLMTEELKELVEAIENDDVVEVADGCADLVVTVLGTAIEYGFDFDAVWQEVHRSNMAKKGGETREDGKHLKPPGWQPPDLLPILSRKEDA